MTDFVIVSYNSTRDVGRLLLQLDMTFAHPHTVTVIDNTHNNRGFAKACNLGAQQGSGEYVAFLNPDIILCPGWADPVRNAFEHDPSLIISGPRLDDGMAWPRDVASNGITNWVCGACFFVRRAFFVSVGGFDERFFFGYEETDLIRRAEGAGYRVETVGEPRVKHLCSMSPQHDRLYRASRAVYRDKWGAA